MNQKKSGLQRLYEASMDQILKLKNIFVYLEQNGYLLIILLFIAGFFIYQALIIAIRIGKALKTSQSSEQFSGTKNINYRKNQKKEK